MMGIETIDGEKADIEKVIERMKEDTGALDWQILRALQPTYIIPTINSAEEAERCYEEAKRHYEETLHHHKDEELGIILLRWCELISTVEEARYLYRIASVHRVSRVLTAVQEKWLSLASTKEEVLELYHELNWMKGGTRLDIIQDLTIRKLAAFYVTDE